MCACLLVPSLQYYPKVGNARFDSPPLSSSSLCGYFLQNGLYMPFPPATTTPSQVYFLRSMAVLIQAGPGGGVDVPAVKAVLHAQGLERSAHPHSYSSSTTRPCLVAPRCDFPPTLYARFYCQVFLYPSRARPTLLTPIRRHTCCQMHRSPFSSIFLRRCSRDKGLKDRSKPRRLASLPGHTDDLLGHGTGEEVGRTLSLNRKSV